MVTISDEATRSLNQVKAAHRLAGCRQDLGDVVCRWTEEATTLNETEPNLKQIELRSYELSGYSIASNTLLADSAVGLEAMRTKLFSQAIAWNEDYAFLRGSGDGKPLGVQNWAGLISATRTTANQFKLADMANMFSRLLAGGRVSWKGFSFSKTRR